MSEQILVVFFFFFCLFTTIRLSSVGFIDTLKFMMIDLITKWEKNFFKNLTKCKTKEIYEWKVKNGTVRADSKVFYARLILFDYIRLKNK